MNARISATIISTAAGIILPIGSFTRICDNTAPNIIQAIHNAAKTNTTSFQKPKISPTTPAKAIQPVAILNH
ncbi:hypothetical protein BALH_0925 [Bacillus thuringiensis str. Al Hakam]|nr:hypothetical protein BALH_0925 [Bacillus thuringiensis str. Al Hakam]